MFCNFMFDLAPSSFSSGIQPPQGVICCLHVKRQMTLRVSVGQLDAVFSIACLINLPGWEALAIMKAGPLWRGVSIALSDTLTCMAAPSWGWPTATFLRVGLRSRGPNKDGRKPVNPEEHRKPMLIV